MLQVRLFEPYKCDYYNKKCLMYDDQTGAVGTDKEIVCAINSENIPIGLSGMVRIIDDVGVKTVKVGARDISREF